VPEDVHQTPKEAQAPKDKAPEEAQAA